VKTNGKGGGFAEKQSSDKFENYRPAVAIKARFWSLAPT